MTPRTRKEFNESFSQFQPFVINTPTDHKLAVGYSAGFVFLANLAGIDPYSCGSVRCDAVQAGEPAHEPECIPDILAAFWRVPDLS